jgi:predicted PurR-regulated permease PerM
MPSLHDGYAPISPSACVYIGRVVKVPALITVVAVLIGGALLGIVGALVAIPIAALSS